MKRDSISFAGRHPAYGMMKYGWIWASENALDAYKLILVDSAYCNGSFGASDHLSFFIDLADEIVRLEGRIPDSFEVAVDLGTIYSAAAVSNAHDVKVSDEFIAKAHEAWRIASTHLDNGLPRNAALAEPGPLRATYVGGYFQIPCEIGFARYIQTNCTDVSHLQALKKYWVRAKQERPNHPILQDIDEQIERKLGPGEHTEHMQEPSPALLPGIGQARLEPAQQGSRPLGMRAVVFVIATLAGLAYVYRPLERASELQHDAAVSALRSASDGGIPAPPETAIAAPAHQPQEIEPSTDKSLEMISYADESAVATPASQQPIKQHQQNGNLLSNITELQQRAATPDNSAEITTRYLASTGASTRQAGSRDVEKAADFERQGLQALVAGNFTEARHLFQASENAANRFRYSYEWARLLQTRQAELETPDGQKVVLQFALAKGYASHAPNDIRDKLRKLAQ